MKTEEVAVNKKYFILTGYFWEEKRINQENELMLNA
jgi:hypothetical protein